MNWFSNPYVLMSFINVGSGVFSAIAGLRVIIMENSPLPNWEDDAPASPWQYVTGGLIAALVGIGNWFQWTLATWGTITFIATSVYDGWFGPGSKDWRFFTLTAYILVQTALVLWSFSMKSMISFP